MSGAVLTIMLSRAGMTTACALRYAGLRFWSGPGGVAFRRPARARTARLPRLCLRRVPIGMTYQVPARPARSPNLVLRARHAILSYLFGVVIVAGSVNLIADWSAATARPQPPCPGCCRASVSAATET